MNQKITTCQQCRKYWNCENAYHDPVFGEHGFDFACFEQDWFSPKALMERAGVEWQKDWPVYFRHAVILDQHGKQFTDWTSGTMAEAKKKFDVEMVCALTLGPPGPNWKPLEIMTCQHCGEKYPADLTDFCPSCGSCNNQPQMSCPKCGAVYDDYDGTGLSYCPACGYCIHPAETTVNGKTTCCVCGRETTRREKKNYEEN